MFDRLVEGENRDFLISLPVHNLVSLLKSDELRVESESTVVALVRDYLAARANLDYNMKLLEPEKVINKDLWNSLTEKEREKRIKKHKKALKKIKKDRFSKQRETEKKYKEDDINRKKRLEAT